MARYGGGAEDFKDEAAKLDALRKGREELIAKESVYQRELEVTEGIDEKAERKRATRRRARREGAEVTERSAKVETVSARATDVDTAAIERNTKARRANDAVRRRQSVNYSRALAGGADPAFARAAAISPGVTPSQYAIRQQISGVGSRRAGNIQQAIEAGLRPQTGVTATAHTRLQDAQVRSQRAETAYEEATRNLTNTRRRKSSTDTEIVQADEARNEAKKYRDARRAEVEQIRSSTQAKKQDVTETKRATTVERKERGPGTELIRHPTEFGKSGPPVSQYPEERVTGQAADRRDSHTPGYDRIRAEATAKGNAAQSTRNYVSELTKEEQIQHAISANRADQVAGRAAAANVQSASGARDAAAGYGTLSQAMTRHGALQSEFITAAARGEVTLKQLGSQALVTAGKFAGWTAAATAIFGLAHAVSLMGEGSIAASTGVDTLKRVIDNVDADQAGEDFNRLSGKFNVPIDTSVDAVYRMGQVFHDQAEATKAAEAALYSYKTGEVDVATSTKNLIAIQQGFGLSADELLSRYDQINQAQNEFGISIGDTEAGLAKAAGTYKNAGGDLNYLLGLFVAIQKATGRSGTEIGTGVARAVQRIREPISRQKLEAQGVDVDPQNFQKTLQSTIKAARRPGADKQELATGLFGNQYARLIAPVLADQDKLNEALEKTSPEASKGSAQKELAHVMDETRERITQVGVSLQRLGESLGRSGAFAGIGLGLSALNEMLQLANTLVGVFDRIPQPWRSVIALMAEGYLILKAMQRFGGTQRLAGGPLGFLANEDQRLGVHATRAARDTQGLARGEAEATARREYLASHRVQIANEDHQDIGRKRDEAIKSGAYPLGSDQRKKLDDGYYASERHLIDTTNKAEEARRETVNATRIAARADQELADVTRLKGQDLRRHLVATGAPIPHDLYSPNTKGYGRAKGQADDLFRKQVDLAADSGAINPERAARARAQNLTLAGSKIDAYTQRAGRYIREGNSRLSQGLGGYAGGGLASTVERSGAALGRRVSGAQRAITGLRGMPGQIRGAFGTILSGLGPLDAILAAIPVGLIIKGKLDEQNAKAKKSEEAATRVAQTAAGYKNQQKELQDTIGRKDPFGGDPTKNEGALPLAKRGIDKAAGLFGYTTPWGREEQAQGDAARELQTRAAVKRMQKRQAATGAPISELFAGEIHDRMDGTIQDLQDGLISADEFREEMKKRGIELNSSSHVKGKKKGELRAIYDTLKRRGTAIADPSDFAGRFEDADPKELRADFSLTAQKLSQVGRTTTKFDLNEVSAEYQYLIDAQKGATSPESIKKLNEDREAYFDAIAKAADREVSEGLLLARNEGDRTDAFSKGRRIIESELAGPRGSRDAARKRQRAAEARVEADKAQLKSLDSGGGGDRQIEPGARDRLKGQLRKDNQKLAQAAKDTQTTEKQYAEALARRNVDLQKIKDQDYQDRQEGRQGRLALTQAQNPGQAAGAAAAVRSAAAQVRDAEHTYTRSSRQYKQALTELLNAQSAQVEALVANVQADNSLLLARAGNDPAAQARAGVTGAQRVLQTLQQHKGRVDPNRMKQAQADLINAQNQQAEQQKQEASQIIDLQNQLAVARAGGDAVLAARLAQKAARAALGRANTRVERLQALVDLANANNQLQEALRERLTAEYDLLESQTTDPVRQADLEVVKARKLIKGTKGTARLNAKANYNRAKQQQVEAHVQDKEDTIDFNLEMGKIERDSAIQQYEALLRTKGLTKQMRRDIMRKIKSLKDEGDEEASGFDLDVGGLKLPTAYDVRRAWDPIREQVKAAHNGTGVGNGDSAAFASSQRDISLGSNPSQANDQVRDAQTALTDARSSVQNQINIWVTDPESAGEVYGALDRILNTSVKAKLRSRGHR